MKHKKFGVVITFLTTAVIAGTSAFLTVKKTNESLPAEERPESWAQPVDINGVPNFYKVTEDLYRGAQPTAEGIAQLKQIGIKTIVNLRSVHSDIDERGDTDIGLERIRFEPWNIEMDEIEKFLHVLADDTKVPVFVHCKYGSDRTGFMCAVYRIAVCRWGKQAAIDEMVNGGFGFHPVWKNIVESLNNLSEQELREIISDDNKLGIPEYTEL